MCHPHLLSIYCANCFKELNASVLPFFFISEAFCLSTLSHLLNRKFSWRIVYILNVLIDSVKPRCVIFKYTCAPGRSVPVPFLQANWGGTIHDPFGRMGPIRQESESLVPPFSLSAILASLWPLWHHWHVALQHEEVPSRLGLSLLMLWNGVYMPGPQASQGLEAGTGRVLY